MAKQSKKDTETQQVSRRARRKIEEEQARKKRIYYIIGAIALAAAVIAFGWWVRDRNQDDPLPDIVAATDPEITVPVSGRVAGDPNAVSVEVVEWGDYQCPGCGAFSKEATPMLLSDYVNTGKITYSFHDFPFLGPESYSAAEAAWCALDQDKFFEYNETVYANQGGENQGYFSDKRLKEMAEVAGLDTDAFNECYDANTHEQDVQDSYAAGAAIGINRTPTLVINGEQKQYAGVEDLRATLDAAIAAAEG